MRGKAYAFARVVTLTDRLELDVGPLVRRRVRLLSRQVSVQFYSNSMPLLPPTPPLSSFSHIAIFVVPLRPADLGVRWWRVNATANRRRVAHKRGLCRCLEFS